MPYQPHDPDHISVSQIQYFSGAFGCPAKYYYKYVLGLRATARGASLVIGTGIGKALQAAPPDGSPRTVQMMLNTWDDYAASVWDSIYLGADRPKMLQKGRDMIKALGAAGLTNVQGVPEYKIDGVVLYNPTTGEALPPLVAFLDWYDPVCSRVTELKTSSSIRGPETYMVQLAVYRYITTREDDDGTRTPPEVRLIQVNRAKSPRVKIQTVTISDAQEDWVLRGISETVNAIRAGHFPTRPSYACKVCDYRKACQDRNFAGLVKLD